MKVTLTLDAGLFRDLFAEVETAGTTESMRMRCNTCGSESIGYDANPHGLPVIHTCVMGVGVTGEPGAERCNDCGSLDVTEAQKEPANV